MPSFYVPYSSPVSSLKVSRSGIPPPLFFFLTLFIFPNHSMVCKSLRQRKGDLLPSEAQKAISVKQVASDWQFSGQFLERTSTAFRTARMFINFTSLLYYPEPADLHGCQRVHRFTRCQPFTNQHLARSTASLDRHADGRLASKSLGFLISRGVRRKDGSMSRGGGGVDEFLPR